MDPIPVSARVAGVGLGLESLGILVLAGWQLVALAGGDTDSLVSSIALIVLTILCGSLVGAFSVAAFGGQSWGFTGGLVTQVLIAAVAFGAASGPAGSVAMQFALLLPAVVLFIVIIVAIRAKNRLAGEPEEGS